MSDFSVIGKSVPLLGSWEKLTGDAKYLSDIKLPGMLYGKVLRSPLPHARILRIDTSRAKKLLGVKALITASDCPNIPFCVLPRLANKFPLARDKVRFLGEEIAAVAAVEQDVAEEALPLIDVEYEELPAVYTPREAMQPEAPLLHEEERNLASHIKRAFGDVEAGFKESDYICEDTFTTSAQAHCALEPRGCIAGLDLSGRLTIWQATHSPHLLREELSNALKVPMGKINVIKVPGGGFFGARMTMSSLEPICGLLARASGRPVKLVNTRAEEFAYAHFRYPMEITLKTGVKKNGRIIAREAKVVSDNGAYNNHATSATGNACAKINQLYNVANTRVEGYIVYTNKPLGGAFRGYGNPQITFAMESQLDMIAEKLGLSPKEIRLLNANQANTVTVSGCKITSCALKDCIEKAAAEVDWNAKWGKGGNRGVGMANVIHGGSGSKSFFGKDCNVSNALVKLNNDGTVDVLTGESDIGQGSDTVLAQITAEELGVKLEDVNIISGETNVTPVSVGTWASRVTFSGGNAVRMAARQAKDQVLQVAAELLEANPEDLVAKDGFIHVRGSPEKAVPLAKAASFSYREKGTPIFASGHFSDPLSVQPDPISGVGNAYSAYSFATQAAEVEVDTETGLVKVLKFAAAHDLGRAINPMGAEGQIEGAIAQGIGYGLMEELLWEKGKLVNDNFADYLLPFSFDMPEVKVILVESNDPNGPFGAKGLGELGLVPSAAAIANAIYDAIGVRIKELPITPEKILRALRKGDS